MTAVSQLNADFFGQSFEPLVQGNPPVSMTNLAKAVDANNLTAGGTITGLLTLLGLVDFSAANTISAAGSTQATGTPLTTTFTEIGTVTAGQGVNSLPSAVGMMEVVVNGGTVASQLYAAQGNTVDTINGIAGSIGVAIPPGALALGVSTGAGAIEVYGINPKKAGYVANTASAAATLTAASMTSGDNLSIIDMTGSLSGGAALTLPTVANYLAALPFANLNSGVVVRIENHSAGNFSWTVTNNGSFVTVGTSTIAQNTWREFNVIVVNGTSVTAQDIGGSTIV